jgi:ketosteroid isomerase-like protein
VAHAILAGMSQANVNTAREVLAAVTQRDLPRLLELTDPEIRWDSFFALASGSQYDGHDGLRQYIADLDEAWSSLEPEVRDLLDAGDVVVGIGRVRYQGRESGVDSEAGAGWMFRFRHGRMVHFRAFNDPEQAFEAVGLER